LTFFICQVGEIPEWGLWLLSASVLREPADAADRPVGRSRRGDGEAVLPEVYGRVHAQVVQAPPHGRRLLRHRIPAYAVHGAPGVQAEKTSQRIKKTKIISKTRFNRLKFYFKALWL